MNRYYSYPSTLNAKREEIRKYFHNSYELFEKVFELLKDESVFYKKSESTRHPMIFYYGHTAAFYINKLILAGILKERINPEFESIFAIGVDEMTWDDLNEENYKWPKVEEVKAYRAKVREVVDGLIATLPLNSPIGWDDPFWIIMMAIEHERIHIETSSVLHRQMPLEFIKEVDTFDISNDASMEFPKNGLVYIDGSVIKLGKKFDDHLYGWDNEYGELTCHVEDFEVSKFLVSNGEFMEFVQNGGYEDESFWDEEGRNFLHIRNAKHPVFWIKEGDVFKYRTLSSIIDMPMNWPVDVNALEAAAFCRYISKRDGITYSLPSEAQWYKLYEHAELRDVPDLDDTKANINLSYNVSACAVDRFDFNGVYDVIGNVWQWTNTPIDGYEGFKVHYAYDDFSTPTFDGKHNIIKGGSFISTGNEIMKHSRYAFRRHFYQHAGFRYVVDSKLQEKQQNDMYESDELVSQYCEFQYGEEYFGVENFAQVCAQRGMQFTENFTKALDIGCATGRASFELARKFDTVEGIDFSARFILVATKLKDEGHIAYKMKEEGDLYSHKQIELEQLGYAEYKEKVSFWQGDACNLKPNFTGYDLILAMNIIDRLYNPKLFLDSVEERLNTGGVLVLTSPYSWNEEFTAKELWLGGYKDKNGDEVHTLENLQILLKERFKLLYLENIPFVIKESTRKYQHTISQMSIWKKR